MWEARSLIHRADVFLALGLPNRAAADFARAEQLFAVNGQELEYAKARHSLGLVALSRGDLPGALGYFDEAGHRYDALRETISDLAIDRCSALLAAGLAAAAAQETDTALSQIPPQGGIAFKKAELLFAAATAALAAGRPAEAAQRAGQARAGCSGSSAGPSGRRGPTWCWPRPGTRPASGRRPPVAAGRGRRRPPRHLRGRPGAPGAPAGGPWP